MSTRIASVDCFRVIAIVAVLAIHSHYCHYTDDYAAWEGWAAIVLNQAARFAVPFYFIIAGYFLGRSVRQGKVPIALASASLRRLVALFFIWSIVFIAIDFAKERLIGMAPNADSAPSVVGLGFRGIVQRIFAGARIHLWFIPALLAGMLVALAFHRFGARIQLIVGGFLFVIGLVAGPYSIPLGVDLGIKARNGPFFSAIFVCLGFQMGYREMRPNFRLALGLLLLGCLLHGIEVAILIQRWDISPFGIDFVVGTIPFALGFAALALAMPRFGEGSVATRIGPLVLGIYLLHLDVEMLVGPINPVRGFLGQILLIAVSFIVTLSLVWLLSRWRATRWTVG